MFASLPMYDFPEVSAATDAWWSGVASALRRAGLDAVPEALTRDPDVDVWNSQELLLSQTCGYTLTHALRGWHRDRRAAAQTRPRSTRRPWRRSPREDRTWVGLRA